MLSDHPHGIGAVDDFGQVGQNDCAEDESLGVETFGEDRVGNGRNVVFLAAVQNQVIQHTLHLRCVVSVYSHMTGDLLNVSLDGSMIAAGKRRTEIARLFPGAFFHQLETIFLQFETGRRVRVLGRVVSLHKALEFLFEARILVDGPLVDCSVPDAVFARFVVHIAQLVDYLAAGLGVGLGEPGRSAVEV